MNADTNDQSTISGLGWLRRIGQPARTVRVTFEGVGDARPSRALFEPTVRLRPLDPSSSRLAPGGYKLEVPETHEILTIFLSEDSDEQDLRGEIIDYGTEHHESES